MIATPSGTPTITATPQPSPTPTTTLTPQPTAILSSAEAAKLGDFLTGSPGCQLPCWNGLTPGVSTAGEVQGFFARLGIDIQTLTPETSSDGLSSIVAEFEAYPYGYKGHTPGITVYSKEGIVKEITFLSMNYSAFTISRLATMLGVPDQIQYKLLNGGGYYLTLQYNKYQTLILILGHGKFDIGENLDDFICIPGGWPTSVWASFYAKGGQSKFLNCGDGPWSDWKSELNLSTEDVFKKLQEPDVCMPIW